MMPAPTHLKNIVAPYEVETDEEALVADIRCLCGGANFELLYPGQTHEYAGEVIPCTAEIDGNFFFVLKVRCVQCAKEHLLLDADFHGWNGFVCHDPEQAALPRPPLTVWKCLKCGGMTHSGVVHIQTEGKADFILEAGEEFDEDLWPDAFGWFSLDVTCNHCGKHTPELVSYETM
jgi:hypothetical protein